MSRHDPIARETLAGIEIGIVGMARSGFAAAKLCLREGAKPVCLDLKRPAGEDAQIAALEAAGVEMVWGPHPEDPSDGCAGS